MEGCKGGCLHGVPPALTLSVQVGRGLQKRIDPTYGLRLLALQISQPRTCTLSRHRYEVTC